MKVNIRRANEWDAPAVLKIYAPFAGKLSAPDAECPLLLEMIERIDRYTYGYGWLVCEIDGVPAGFCYVTEHKNEPKNPFKLDLYIFVKEEFQHRCVGKGLFCLLSRILEYGNRRQIFVHLAQEDKQAFTFFHRLGFEEIETTAEVILMKYELCPDNAMADCITKPYLIDNKAYEDNREHAQNLVKS
ncbi:GNAT family N-acetyltransferase [Scatolibacter rhodanostii]|uniref:GNAT family N-acetyltransferase n=1 Tax=Scatolibacter rhodanostii TaxID=2014781 RepID=UPI000C07EEC2|nr:GNAT family N-acetyltransferase [Scatolibacter rhodanostii]